MNKEQLELRISEGFSQKRLANYFNVSTGTITYWLTKFKLSTINKKNNKKHSYSNNFGLTEKEYKKLINSELISKKRKEFKLYAISYLGGKCEKCGYNKCVAALEFHHLDPKEKEFALSDYRKLFKEKVLINKELDKCMLLCANCHREEHNY